MAANTFHGIIVYEILDDGNVLNGIYANTEKPTKPRYDIDNEIARKDSKGNPFDNSTDQITWQYSTRYIESSNPGVATSCKLTITKVGPVFELVWIDGDKPIFYGIGVLTGSNHFSVSYVTA